MKIHIIRREGSITHTWEIALMGDDMGRSARRIAVLRYTRADAQRGAVVWDAYTGARPPRSMPLPTHAECMASIATAFPTITIGF